jgi:hypothetical protein
VTNNSTNNSPILNLTPVTTPVVDDSTCAPFCTATKVSGPTPTSYPSLKPGDSATFSWVYTIIGKDANKITFTTSLLNGIGANTASSDVEVRDVVSALESGTSLSSLGLDTLAGSKDVLYLHMETFDTPLTSYQLSTTTAEGAGKYIDLKSEVPNFFNQNASAQNIIPAGTWTASIRYLHQYLPDSLIESGNNEVDMIYHLNDNVDNEPDSSANTPGLNRCDNGAPIVNKIQSQTGTGNPTATVTFSPTPTQGNLLVAIAATRTGNSGATTASVVTGTGWIKAVENYYYTAGEKRGLAIFYKIAGASEAASIGVQWNNGGTDTNLIIQEFSVNQGGTFTYDVSASGNSASSSVTSLATGTTAQSASANSFVVTGLMTRDNTSAESWSNSVGNNQHWQGGTITINTGYKSDSVQGAKSSTASWTTARPATAGIVVFSITGGQQTPTYVATGGPDNSPYYHFDGNDCITSNFNVNDANYGQFASISGKDDTTALWFRADSSTAPLRGIMYRVDGASTAYDVDFYQISLGDGTVVNKGKLVFQFDPSTGTNTVNCISTARYDDNIWHHVVAVRDNDRRCKLYVDGNSSPVASSTNGGAGNSVDSSSVFKIGYNGASEFFIGDIDQIFHWNDKALSTTEIADLYNTRYGDTTDLVDFSLYKTNYNGVNIEPPLIQTSNYAIKFKDTKDLSTTSEYDSLDSIWGHMNYTTSLSQVTLDPGQKLNFTIAYKNGLDMFMRIDDNTMSAKPKTSFIQTPIPLNEYESFFKYDHTKTLMVAAFNAGPLGSWFQYQGTRAVFDNLNGPTSYAGLVCSVNSTQASKCDTGAGNNNWKMDEDHDSIFIPVNNIAYLYFWEIADRPDQNDPGGTIIPAGTYHMYVFVSGYDESGKSFLRQIDVGKVTVT